MPVIINLWNGLLNTLAGAGVYVGNIFNAIAGK